MALSVLRAVEELKRLLEEGKVPHNEPELISWHSRVRAVMSRSLGPGADLVTKVDEVRYTPGFMPYGGAVDYQTYRNNGMARTSALIEAAIFELDLLTPQEDVLGSSSFDVELWENVESLIATEDWVHLPAAVVIFLEHKVRTWAGLDKSLVGKGLYSKALADNGLLRLGAQPGEWEGWRMFGMALAQAVGNVDRHRLELRQDARAYAIGVLGAGSLLLTQIRAEHRQVIADAEAKAYPGQIPSDRAPLGRPGDARDAPS